MYRKIDNYLQRNKKRQELIYLSQKEGNLKLCNIQLLMAIPGDIQRNDQKV